MTRERAMKRGRPQVDPIEREIEAALLPGDFIKYGRVSSFVDSLERVEHSIARLVRASAPRAVSLYEVFIAGCYEKSEELDDSGGSFGMFVGRLFGAWVKVRQRARSDPDETATRLVRWMEDDAYGYCHQLERELVKLLHKPGLAAFERRVRERFESLTALREAEPPHDYPRRRAAEILRAILAAKRDVAAYVVLCDATTLTSADCLALARMCHVRRKPNDALAWVERGLALEAKRDWSLCDDDLRKLQRELLRKLGRSDAALDAAWAEFTAHPSTYTYDGLVEYVPKAERASWHAKAMDAAAGADLSSLIELYVETKETDRLVARLRDARDADLEALSHYIAEPLADKLAGRHPELAARILRAQGMRILDAKKSRYYDAALSYFEDARRCYERAGLGKAWEQVVIEIRAKHHRKLGFMAGFEEVVTGAGPNAKPTFLERAKARWPRSSTEA